jgi:hypothetical protein
MTNTMIAAVAALTLSTAAASANDLAFLGGLEYAVEAEVFEATAGIEYTAGNFTITPVLTLNDATGKFEFAAAELTVDYAVATSVNVYVTAESDSNWKHTETTLGVALRF